MTLLKVSGIRKEVEADFSLQDISFSQRKFQKIAIAGETGSGKSTLLKIISGLAQADNGEVMFEGERVKGTDEKLVGGHPGIAYLSQNFELAKFLRVEQVLSYSNILTNEEADTLFEVCQINHLLKRKTDQLSGGEKQRIAMARLLISWPKLLLLDEPFSHLDMVHKNTLKSVIHDIGEKLKITCILVSHDPDDTLSWADKIIVMKDGKMVQKGSPEKIYSQPKNEYTAGLFGKYNLLTATQFKAFGRVPGLQPNRKKLFLRPENFKIVPKGSKGVKGKITQVKFYGSHYELEISLPENRIILKTEKSNCKEGGTVNVSITALHDLWYI